MSESKVCIITPGGLPVPSVDGGAVQNLIEMLIQENEIYNKIDLYIVTPFNEKAIKVSEKLYPKTNFIWVKAPKIFSVLDDIVYKVLKVVFKNQKALSFRNNFKMFYFSFFSAKLLKKENFEKIVIENNIRNFWTLKLFKNYKKYDQNYYFHLHNVPRISAGCKKIIKKCKKILCVSDFISQTVQSEANVIGPIEQNRVDVYKNAVDIKLFNTEIDINLIEEYKNKFKIDKNDFIVVFAGRLIKEKGALEAIRALKQIDNPNIKLMIVGACYYNSDVKNDFLSLLEEESKELRDRIIFTGYVDYNFMPVIYNLGDIALLPSIWDEPAGMTIIEAACCGLPVITTNSGGIPEYTVEGGSIILERDEMLIENIKESIIKLYEDKNLVSKMKDNCLKFTKEYNKENYYKNFIKKLGFEWYE